MVSIVKGHVKYVVVSDAVTSEEGVLGVAEFKD